jgi:hypothetical protein
VGIGLAPVIIGGLALVTVAGALGRAEADRADDPPAAVAAPDADLERPGPVWDAPLDYHQAVLIGQVRGPLGWVLMTALALGLLGPACHAPSRYRERLHNANRSIPAVVWAVAGALGASGLMLSGWALDLPRMFLILGALASPLLGVVAGDGLAAGFRWPGPRAGVNPCAALGWVAGVAVALGPLWAQGVLDGSPLTLPTNALTDRLPIWPTVLAGYLVALFVSLAAGLLRLGTRTVVEESAA